jgi:hypothetical protein
MLRNSSFEEDAQSNLAQPPYRRTPPKNWIGLYSSSPDQQPGTFGVSLKAFKGNYFAGFVSRPPNGPSSGWERMAQKLETPLVKNQSYTVLLHLCYDPNFAVKWNNHTYHFHDPIPLSFCIFNLNSNFPVEKIIGTTSNPIDHQNWRLYSFTFQVEEDGFDYFGFSAEPPGQIALGANIMIDEVFLAKSNEIGPIQKEWERADSILNCAFFLPNLLIRGNASSNQYFKPSCADLVRWFEVEIYNRWGKLVYQGNLNSGWWKGDDNSNNELSDGVYYYQFNYSFYNLPGAEKKSQSGMVTLMTER